MSYNISVFKIKKIENLEIPLLAFFEHERKDWHPIKKYNEEKLILECGCEQEITGIVENNILKIESMNMAGEGSGTFIDWILEPALKKSRGILEASCVWERGDSINKLIVNNGNVKWEKIEI